MGLHEYSLNFHDIDSWMPTTLRNTFGWIITIRLKFTWPQKSTQVLKTYQAVTSFYLQTSERTMWIAWLSDSTCSLRNDTQRCRNTWLQKSSSTGKAWDVSWDFYTRPAVRWYGRPTKPGNSSSKVWSIGGVLNRIPSHDRGGSVVDSSIACVQIYLIQYIAVKSRFVWLITAGCRPQASVIGISYFSYGNN